MKQLLFTCLIASIMLSACTWGSGEDGAMIKAPQPTVVMKTIRAKQLEPQASIITLVKLTPEEWEHYMPGDTAWVNLETHRIDDTCNTTMACVLLFDGYVQPEKVLYPANQ